MLYVRLVNYFMMVIGPFFYASLSKSLKAVASSGLFRSMRYISFTFSSGLLKPLETYFLITNMVYFYHAFVIQRFSTYF